MNHDLRTCAAFCHLSDPSTPGVSSLKCTRVLRPTSCRRSTDLEKPPDQVYYIPMYVVCQDSSTTMYVVCKDSSTTTRVHAVFDASAGTSTGVSLNSTLMVGPTVHLPLVDVLIRFRRYRIAMITDVSRMYRAMLLVEPDKDLHRFIWRNDPSEPLRDYRMTRVTFGVSASSFIANMCVKQNHFRSQFPRAAKQIETSFYVDDYLGANYQQGEMHSLFLKGGFVLEL